MLRQVYSVVLAVAKFVTHSEITQLERRVHPRCSDYKLGFIFVVQALFWNDVRSWLNHRLAIKGISLDIHETISIVKILHRLAINQISIPLLLCFKFPELVIKRILDFFHGFIFIIANIIIFIFYFLIGFHRIAIHQIKSYIFSLVFGNLSNRTVHIFCG